MRFVPGHAELIPLLGIRHGRIRATCRGRMKCSHCPMSCISGSHEDYQGPLSQIADRRSVVHTGGRCESFVRFELCGRRRFFDFPNETWDLFKLEPHTFPTVRVETRVSPCTPDGCGQMHRHIQIIEDGNCYLLAILSIVKDVLSHTWPSL